MDMFVQAFANLADRSPEQRSHTFDVEPGCRRFEPERLSVAAVRPVLGAGYQAGRDGVSIHVRKRSDQPSDGWQLPIPRAILEEMRRPPISAVRSSAVISVDLTEPD
jgi:hypothetical protein